MLNMKLKPIINTELSEYTVNLLYKHRITTVADFIRTSIEKLMKILNLNEEKIFEIITSIEKLYGGRKQNLKQREQDRRMFETIYKTGIISLDNILGCESLKSGVVWEFCGLPGVGKSQLAFTVLINFIINTDCQVLYIDTKMDFSSMRIQQMLNEKGLKSMEERFNIMEHIKLERCLSPMEVLQMLYNLEVALEKRQPCVSKIKLIIIDSIPALWYQLKSTKQNNSIKKLYLIQLDRILHKLAQKYFMAIIVINISLNALNILHCKSDVKQSNMYSTNVMIQGANTRRLTPTLGLYWKLVPRLRLSIEYPVEEADKDASLRIIKIIKSSYTDNSRKSCKVHLTEKGVI